MSSLYKVETKLEAKKSPLDLLHLAYNSEIVSKFFLGLPHILPIGVSEKEIEALAVSYLRKYGCEPSLKGYRGFPSDISISKNHIITHGIPSDDKTKEGDVLTIDIVSKYYQWFSDISWTYTVGNLEHSIRLLKAAWAVSCAGVQAVEIGKTLYDVVQAVQAEATNQKAFVYTQFIGHGIGAKIHETPYLLYDDRTKSIPISNGMVLCIEPIVSLYPQNSKRLPNGSYVGVKQYPTAVYEHMVAVCGRSSRLMSYGMIDVKDMPLLPPNF